MGSEFLSLSVYLQPRRHLFDQYRQCTSAAEVTITQEKILRDLEEAYSQSRTVHGTPHQLRVLRKSNGVVT